VKVKIDKDLCIGCGLCVTIAEKTFRLNDEGKVEVLKQGGDKDNKIQEAIDSCPVQAISVE
jgi:ferredoxin